ncbi:hypothetical protein EXIGLDRAFT_782089 [Exidia glandulosa HHB12029]|uniref:Uncharacterized protein n=1 Tax=Exidia glandulosa HHB12029 TaxID=1314781 RepID=A0A165B0B9_EXIGL|nr:hypothetical protein EXIGLDRAFT_782089 [Exidia glandulosa HHB12029]
MSKDNATTITAMSNSNFCLDEEGTEHVGDRVSLAQICRLVFRDAHIPKSMHENLRKASHPVPALPGVSNFDARDEEYDDATALYWPKTWETSAGLKSTQHCSDISPLVDMLCREYNERRTTHFKSPATGTIKEASEEMAKFLETNLNDILRVTLDMNRIMAKDTENPGQVVEAEWRGPFDRLQNLCLNSFWNDWNRDKTEDSKQPQSKQSVEAGPRITTFVERVLNLPRNPLLSGDDSHDFDVFRRIKNIMNDQATLDRHQKVIGNCVDYCKDVKVYWQVPKQVNKGKLSYIELCLEKAKTAVSHHVSNMTAWGEAYNPDPKLRQDNPDLASRKAINQEPRTGTCDIISVMHIDVNTVNAKVQDQDQHNRFYDFLRRTGDAPKDAEPKGTNAYMAEHVHRYTSTGFVGDIMGSSSVTSSPDPFGIVKKFAKKPSTSSDAGVKPGKVAVVVDVPLLIGEMKRNNPKYEPQAGNQLRQYLTSGVEFLAALDIRDTSIYGFITNRNVCSIVAAFAEENSDEVSTMTRDRSATIVKAPRGGAQPATGMKIMKTVLNKKHIIEREVVTYDLLSPIGTLNFVTFLLWIRYNKAPGLLKTCNDKLANFEKLKSQPLPDPHVPLPHGDTMAWTEWGRRPPPRKETKKKDE